MGTTRAFLRRRLRAQACGVAWPSPKSGGAVSRRSSASLLVLTVALLGFSAPVKAQDAGDPAAGKTVFNRCRSCHQVGETARNVIGPELNGIVGAKAGSVSGYKYSDALQTSGAVWDEAALHDFLKKPKAKVPGTKMTFAGLSTDKDIANVIAYLKQYGADGKVAQ
ncbi:MAG: cytochrome c family protein [Fulvimarina sp.]|nr:cytochrome c family protein [Fulvimarina sp.]